MPILKKQDFTPELEYRIYRSDASFLFVCSFIIVLTNLFWFFNDLHQNEFSVYCKTPRCWVIALLIVSSIIVIISFYPGKERNAEYIRTILRAFLPLIGIETTVLCIIKNIDAYQAGEVYNGIPLSTLYLFIFICVPFVDIMDSIFMLVPVFSTVVVPAFTAGHESYNIVATAVMGAAVIIGCFAYRHVLISEQINWLKIQSERGKFKELTTQSLETISATIDAKNPYLNGHSKRVALYSRDIAKKIDLSEEDIDKIYFCGLLHDVGKIAIPSKILNKPEPLSKEEYDLIKKHTVFGSDILNNMNVYPELSECARYHHERFDGQGYPDGINGMYIPLFAKIICVADAYDAMTSKRSYRDALSKDIVIAEFEKGRGSQFDPVITDIVVEMLKQNDWHYDVE